MWKKSREVGTCLSVEELSALYDRAIAGKAAERLREHLALCPKCVREFKVLGKLMTGLEPRAAPEALLEKATRRPRPAHPVTPQRKPAARSRPRLV